MIGNFICTLFVLKHLVLPVFIFHKKLLAYIFQYNVIVDC